MTAKDTNVTIAIFTRPSISGLGCRQIPTRYANIVGAKYNAICLKHNAATNHRQPHSNFPARTLAMLAATKPSMTLLYWKWPWSISMIAGCIKIATSAIEYSQRATFCRCASRRPKTMTAGTKTRYSEIRTVARM